MKLKTLPITCVLIFSYFFFFGAKVNAQLSANSKQDSTTKKFFIGTTLFLLGNFSSSNNPEFAQLNIGYRPTPQDAVSLELKTWKYAWSLGIPYGPLREAPETEWPGFIREAGFAIAYQRFLWKGLYTAVHVMNAWQRFVDTDGNKIDNGFQIFNTYRLGYQFTFWNKRIFIEPNIAITHRPIHTEMPASFKEIDDQYSKFFFGEPGFHLGFNF